MQTPAPIFARFAVLATLLWTTAGRGETIRNDAHVLNTIFDDGYLEQNVHDVRLRAARLAPEDRYRFLAGWVLPGEQHPTFRVTGTFDQQSLPPQHALAASDISPLGDSLATPVFDLIEVARQTGRLQQLRDRLIAAPALELHQNRCRAALLFLVQLVRDDVPSATAALGELMTLSDESALTSARDRWPDLLVLWRGVPDPRTRRMLADYYFTVYPNIVPYVADTQLDVMNDYLRALSGLRRALDSTDSPGHLREPPVVKQWIPFSYADAGTRGLGRPAARWQLAEGAATKCSGHERDYLSFRSPLRGDYQVECEFSYGPGLNSFLLTAGTRLEFIGRETAKLGNFRKQTNDVVIAPPLAEFREWGHYRATVRNELLTLYVNGRQVLQRRLSPHHDPWTAFGAWRRSQGGVRDVRITGDPIVPAEINLTADPRLDGWAPYFDDHFGGDEGAWAPDENNGIRGKQRPEFAGSAVERLLRYHRPVIEDGTIEYEFFYREREVCVHPALDRMALLLEADGIRLHWITDGVFNQSRDPANELLEPEHQRGPRPLPLIDDDWNQLRLNVAGDVVRISLNGLPVYERVIEDDNLRTFGLFHFADRTEARARNVIWRGAWPRQMPSVEEQQLADRELDFLDESRGDLAAVLHHDFRNGVPPELFDFTGDETSIDQLENGIRTERSGGDGLEEICGCFQLHGDYDICARFDDLRIEMPVPEWQAGIGIMTHLDNLTLDSCALYRRHERNADGRRAAFAHKAQQSGGEIAYTGQQIAEDSGSGRLRLARRGDTVYALFAEGDSPNYRLVSRKQVPSDDVAFQGVRLVLQSEVAADVQATWTDLEVRAERISGLPVADVAPLLAALNDRHDNLPGRDVDLSDQAAVAVQFLPTIGPAESRIGTPSGVRLSTSTNDGRPNAAIGSRFAIGREFDIQADLSVDRLDDPERLGAHSQIAFQVFLQSEEVGTDSVRQPTEAALILRQKANGVRDLVARVITRDRAGNNRYVRLRSLHVESPDQVRIALHDQRIWFLYSESGSADVHVVAEYPVEDSLSAGNVMLSASASGNGRVTEVTWQRFSAYGDPGPLRPDSNGPSAIQ